MATQREGGRPDSNVIFQDTFMTLFEHTFRDGLLHSQRENI